MAVHDAFGIFDQVDPVVWLVTSRAGTQRGGLIATFVNNVSLVPEMPRVVIAIAKHHHTWDLIEDSNSFALHLLGENNLELVWRFGLRSGRDFDKFEGLETIPGATGSPLLHGTLGVIDCRVENSMDLGDRTVYAAEVVTAEYRSTTSRLTANAVLQRATLQQATELNRLLQIDIKIDTDAIVAFREKRDTKKPLNEISTIGT